MGSFATMGTSPEPQVRKLLVAEVLDNLDDAP